MLKQLVAMGALSVLATAAQAAVIIPVTGGQYGGSLNQLNPDGSYNATANYHNLADALNNQPTGLDPITGVPIGQPAVGYGDSGTPGYGGGWGFIDFGADWANVRITQAWTLSRGWAHGGPSPYQELYWHNDTNAFKKQVGSPVTIPGAQYPWQEYIEVPVDAIQETTLNFLTQASNAYPAGDFTWMKDLDLTIDQAITPAARYLVMQSASPMTAFQEIAIVGEIVPEPGVLSLLALAGMGGLLRRRRA